MQQPGYSSISMEVALVWMLTFISLHIVPQGQTWDCVGWEHLIISLPAKAQAKIALKLLIAFHLERVVFPPLHPTEFGGCSGFPLAAIYRKEKNCAGRLHARY